MANEKIDVKAEAEEIELEVRAEMRTDTIQAWIVQRIESLASRVRAEAKRETVDRCIAIVKQQFAAGRRPEIERVLRQAFAEPGKEQEPPTQRDLAAMLDAELEAPEPEPRNIGKEIIADLKELNLRQLIDAAVELADLLDRLPKGIWPGLNRELIQDRATLILRLAPQFREKK